MKNCLVCAVYTDVGSSLSIGRSPDFYIGDLPDRQLSAPRFPMKVNFQRGRITDSSSRNASQLVIRVHNETLSIVMCLRNHRHSPVSVNAAQKNGFEKSLERNRLNCASRHACTRSSP